MWLDSEDLYEMSLQQCHHDVQQYALYTQSKE